MTEPSLGGAWEKLRRANEHLTTLHDEIQAFLYQEPKPHSIEHDFDADTSTFVARLRIHKEPPEYRWGVLVGDFAHNVRSALDHLVWQFVLLSGKEPGRANQFPIAERGTAYWCARKDRPSMRDEMLRGVADEYRAGIDQAQPYRRLHGAEADPLAILAWLSNTDKHRLIHAAFVAVDMPNLDEWEIEGADTEGTAQAQMTSGPLEDGAEVIRLVLKSTTGQSESKVGVKGSLPVGIGFGERGLRATFLKDILGYVGAILEAFAPAFERD